MSRGDKSLVGNSGFRKFLKVVGDDHFALDEAKVAEEARLDGFYVLRTNSKLPTLEVAMRYRELWKVEQIFRTTKAVLETRPRIASLIYRRALPVGRAARGAI